MTPNETPDTIPTTIPAPIGIPYDAQADAATDAPTVDDIDAVRWNPDENARPIETATPDPDPVDPFTAQTIGTDPYDPLTIPGDILARMLRSWAGSSLRWQMLDPHRSKPACREEADDDAAALYLWATGRGEDWYRARGLRTGDHAGFRALLRGCARRMHWRIPNRADSRSGRPRTAADRLPMIWKHGSPACSPAAVADAADALRTTAAAIGQVLNGTSMPPESPAMTDDGRHETTHYPAQRGTYRRPARMEWVEIGSAVRADADGRTVEEVTLEARMVERWSGSPVEWPAGNVVNVLQAVNGADVDAADMMERATRAGRWTTRRAIRHG